MNHVQLQQLAAAPLALKMEEQTQFRLERAKRLLDLARQRGGPERLAGITLEQLAVMPPAFAVARLGLPSSVWLDELRGEKRREPTLGIAQPASQWKCRDVKEGTPSLICPPNWRRRAQSSCS